MIIRESNFLSFDNIPKTQNGKNLNFVLYESIFSSKSNKAVTKLLENLEYNNNKIWFTYNNDLFYENLDPHLFPSFLTSIRRDLEHIMKRPFNVCILHKINNRDMNIEYNISELLTGVKIDVPTILFGDSRTIKFSSNGKDEIVDFNSGSILVQSSSTFKTWNTSLSKEKDKVSYIMSFFYIYPFDFTCNVKVKKEGNIPTSFTSVFLKTAWRTIVGNMINKKLHQIRDTITNEKCVISNDMSAMNKHMELIELIGFGDWGNVYSARFKSDKKNNYNYSLKMSRITEEDFKSPYTDSSTSWYEIWLIKDVLKPLIEYNICPNLPLFIDSFLCGRCNFIANEQETVLPCIITVTELAQGDFHTFLNYYTYTDKELYSALFQIMAGLYAIQMSGQILNNDIKSRNILFHTVKAGGYWHYKIKDYDFYVPNYGKLFILNDFGVSTLYNPNLQMYPNKTQTTFNLGSRYAININNKFYPFTSDMEYSKGSYKRSPTVKWKDCDNDNVFYTTGATFRLLRETGEVVPSIVKLSSLQKKFLFDNNITIDSTTWEFFENSEIIPPFEFYNDVQDVLRMFTGGKRTTQRGNHKKYEKISSDFKKVIRPYMGESENSKDRVFDTHVHTVLASSFIMKFFTESVDYTKKPKGKKIFEYDMNKCTSITKSQIYS